jgi:hypothetical protein
MIDHPRCCMPMLRSADNLFSRRFICIKLQQFLISVKPMLASISIWTLRNIFLSIRRFLIK